MIEKVVNAFSLIFFGKAYLEGYIKESSDKESYTLMPLFPNEEAKLQVTDILKKN